MADLTITISNNLNVFGIDQTDNWGTMLWGDNWGYGDNTLIKAVDKFLTETLSLADSISLETTFNLMISEAMTISGDMYDERITDTNNYNKVFGSSDNAENSPMTGYARGSGSSPTYATVSTPSTTWTEQ
jgi:hypothetical protein